MTGTHNDMMEECRFKAASKKVMPKHKPLGLPIDIFIPKYDVPRKAVSAPETCWTCPLRRICHVSQDTKECKQAWCRLKAYANKGTCHH